MNADRKRSAVFPFNYELSEEQIAEMERAKLEADIYKLHFQTFLAEISEDDLEVIHSIFAHILHAQDPRHVANFYYGVVFGAKGVRAASGEGEDTVESLFDL